jgi:sirohydrochlorin ferrochelatase
MNIGIAVFAHGSSVESANEAVRIVAKSIADSGDFPLTATSFLEGGSPDLPTAVEELLLRGAARILVVPYFLTVGLHLKRDLPNLIAEIQQKHPNLDIRVTPPLDGHPALGAILLDRTREAVAQWL